MTPAARIARPWIAMLAALFALAWTLSAFAQAGAPQMNAQVDADTVGVGDVVHVTVSVQSSDAMPSDPDLGATPGFVSRGRSVSPSQTHISVNGNRMDRYGLNVDFTLQAQRQGVYSLGPPTVVVNGQKYQGHAVTVHVVAAAGPGPADRSRGRGSSRDRTARSRRARRAPADDAAEPDPPPRRAP